VPIGGIHTSPMKLTRAYAALENEGMLPQVRFLVAVIGARGNVLGTPGTKEAKRVMAPRTAAFVLQDLRGPVRYGTARSANSAHALVFGKTGTSSRNEDALFVGLTRDFVGCFWLGYDRPAPMPGVHGGGGPARAFAAMTDFHYLRLARNEYAARRAPKDDWQEWRRIAPPEPLRSALVFGAVLMLSIALARRPQPAASAEPQAPGTVEAPIVPQSAAGMSPATTGEATSAVPVIPAPEPVESNIVDGPWGRAVEA
jgi:membrane peptidoglycan carboxypeptidase